MASKTFYFLDTLATGSNYLQLQDGGSPPAQARISTGWIVSNLAPTRYSNMDSQTERASTSLTGTVLPNLPPNNVLGDCFRTQDKYLGNFELGNWEFNFQVEGETRSTSTTDGRIRLKIWKSPNANGSNAIEITTGTAITTSQFVNISNTAFQNITGVANLPSFSLNNEYIFFQIAFQLDGAGNNANCDVHLAVGSGNRFDSANFVAIQALNGSLNSILNFIEFSSSGIVAILLNKYKRIKCAKVQPNGNDNRITLMWIGPDNIERNYDINQNTLNQYNTAEELKAAIDLFTQHNFGYVLNDIWFHKNVNRAWAIATGPTPPAVWPEDEPVTP